MARKPRLSPEDQALWEAVRRTVNPLGPVKKVTLPPLEEPAPLAIATPTAAAVPAPKAPVRPSVPPYYPPVSKPKKLDLPMPDIDRKTRRSIARGHLDIDARLDLHGLTQTQAHGRLHAFLATAQALGHRVVLVITGKGRGGEVYRHPEPERGVLRSVVPHWLEMPEFRRFVLSFQESHVTHGGEGAIYILVRKRKTGHRNG